MDDAEFLNVVTLPLQVSGKISLRIEMISGEVVEAIGGRAQLDVVGPYTFVENTSFD